MKVAEGRFLGGFRTYTDLVALFLFGFGIFFTMVGSVIKRVPLVMGIMFCLYLLLLYHSIAFKKKNIFYIIFLFAFGVFMIWGEYVEQIFGVRPFYQFDDAINRSAGVCVILAMVGLGSSKIIWDIVIEKRITPKAEENQEKDGTIPFVGVSWIKVFRVLHYLVPVLLIASILVLALIDFEQIQAVQASNFLRSYTGFRSSYPRIMVKFAEMNGIFLAIYLASMPSNRSLYSVTLIVLFERSLTLLQGQRFPFVLTYLLLLAYFIYRKSLRVKKGDKGRRGWVRRNIGILCLILIFPLLIYMTGKIEDRRMKGVRRSSEQSTKVLVQGGQNSKAKDPSTQKKEGKKISPIGRNVDRLLQNVHQQGYSINVIKLANYYRNRLPEGKIYTFGSTIDYFENNSLARKMGHGEDWYQGGNSVDRATKGHSLSHAISYIVLYRYYLEGRGVGGSYIAENFHDFSYQGVLIFSFLLGIILHGLYCKQNFFLATFAYLNYGAFLRSPRDSWDRFIAQTINIGNIAAFTLIILVAILLVKAGTRIRGGKGFFRSKKGSDA